MSFVRSRFPQWVGRRSVSSRALQHRPVGGGLDLSADPDNFTHLHGAGAGNLFASGNDAQPYPCFSTAF